MKSYRVDPHLNPDNGNTFCLRNFGLFEPPNVFVSPRGFYCCDNAKTCFFSFHPGCTFTLYCLSFSFTFSSIHSCFVFSLLFLSFICCSFFYFSVPFFRFVCFSLPHFSSFHHLLFICHLIAYFCFLTSRRLDSVSHTDCNCMFSGM